MIAQRWLGTRLLLRLFGIPAAALLALFALPILLAALDPRALQKELALMSAWALSLAILAAWTALRLTAAPLWIMVLLLPLPVLAIGVFGGLGLERRDLGVVLGCLTFEGLVVAAAWHLTRLRREGAPWEKAARWEALSRQMEGFRDGGHPRIARGRATPGALAWGDQLLLRGPDYWIWRPAQFNARLGVVRDGMLQPEPLEGGRHRLRVWAGSAGLGAQSWILDFEPAQWAKLAPHLPKESP